MVQVEQSRLKPNGEFRFARGWFIVASAESITPDRSHRLFFFGRKMVAFRNPDGAVSVLDAVCPHMGAELGVNGVIDEGGVRCPYHHWRFGPDGKCNDIPYSKVIPPKARVHTYPVREVNGLIFVWHDPEFGEPDFEIPVLEAYDDPQWVRWDLERRDIHSVPMELLDNIADYGHFEPVHFSKPMTFENQFKGHQAIQIQTATHDTLASKETGVMTSVTTYHGPGFLLTHQDALYDSYLHLSNTPIDDENMAIWYGMMIKSNGPITPEFMQMRDEYVDAGRVATSQDVDIWENKTFVERPMLCRDDGQILQAREWYRQFLRPRQPALQEAAE
jgi:3-ketosteroid 9alpha-monooxygenase subunit A